MWIRKIKLMKLLMHEEEYNIALEFDRNDPLKEFKDHFINDKDVVYLDGNSLGKLPRLTPSLFNDLVREQWGNRLIRSWNEKWMDLPLRIAGKIASIVGARDDEIFVGDSTTVNLYKLAFAALSAKPGIKRIISDELNFPADLYVLQGLTDLLFKDCKIELIKSVDGISIAEDQLPDIFDGNAALLVLSHVAFKSAFMYNMDQVNRLAHEQNSLVIWDLSHSAGAVPVHLNKCDADLAVGCTYKYLNGGPGSPSFLYVRKDLQNQLSNPIKSWFSHVAPFGFELEYQAHPTIQKFATGTPHILSLAAIEQGLDISLEAGIESIRTKSLNQSEYMIRSIEKLLLPLGFSIASPADAAKRGSHVSIRHKEAYRINRAMIEPSGKQKVIIPDFRPPDNIRLGITPLYTSFSDIYYSIERIRKIMLDKEYERFGIEKLRVT